MSRLAWTGATLITRPRASGLWRSDGPCRKRMPVAMLPKRAKKRNRTDCLTSDGRHRKLGDGSGISQMSDPHCGPAHHERRCAETNRFSGTLRGRLVGGTGPSTRLQLRGIMRFT